MKKIIVLIMCLILAVQVFASDKFDAEAYYPNVILVCFRAEAIGTTTGEIDIKRTENEQIQIGLQSFDKLAIQYDFVDMVQKHKVKDKKWHTESGAYPMNTFKITIKDNSVIENAIDALQVDSSVIFAGYEGIMRQFYTPNDPMFTQQWHHDVIQSQLAWDIARSDTTVIIGIVDSGVQWNHPDLRDNIYINWAEMPGVTIDWDNGVIIGGDGIDNDGNGYIDDVLGWNFSYLPGDNNVYQSYMDNNHGTHVSGCAAAVGDNGIGVSGVAMNVKLLISRHTIDTDYTPGLNNPYDGIFYTADNGAHIINCSWGGSANVDYVNMTIDYATAQGALVVVAAGNNGTESITYPAGATNCLSVAASNINDEVTGFSTFGTWVDMIAPGNLILSTYFNPIFPYIEASGTSMASPVVSGAAALIKMDNPQMTPLEIKARLKQTGDIIPQMLTGYYVDKLGSGRLNVYRALMNIANVDLSITSNIIVEEHDGDGDGIPNIGETISIKVEVQNGFGAADAVGVVATILPQINGVTVSQNTLNYGTIESGNSVTPINAALVIVDSSVNTLTIPFTIQITANQGTDFAFAKTFPFTINLSMSKPNWPLELNGKAVTAPKVADLDGTGNRFVTVYDGIVHVVDALKNYNEGFPLDLELQTQTNIAIGHLNGAANTQQIVVITNSGVVMMINHLGQIVASRNIGFVVRTSPMIADLVGNGQNQIIFGTQNQRVFILNGHDLSDWGPSPITINGGIVSQMALGDLNNNGVKNIVFNTANPSTAIHALDPSTGENLPGFPISHLTNIGPSLADLNGDGYLEIVISGNNSVNCPVRIYKFDGSLVGETTVPSRLNTEIALVDLFENGSVKLVFGDVSGNLYVLNSDLSNVNGFPKALGSPFTVSPVFATLGSESTKSIVLADNAGSLHIIKASGQYASGYPFNLECGTLNDAAWIGALNNDNASVFLVSAAAVQCIDTKIPIRGSFWSSYRANIGNTACFSDIRTPEVDDIEPLLTNSLLQNYPNPFNPITTIDFSIKRDGNVQIFVYNIKGQLVNTLLNEPKKAGQHQVRWNGIDHQNKAVASGLYFYKIQTENFTDVKKMILVK